eukprot:5313298-Pleurochrysis_carterae.AAC.4
MRGKEEGRTRAHLLMAHARTTQRARARRARPARPARPARTSATGKNAREGHADKDFLHARMQIVTESFTFGGSSNVA